VAGQGQLVATELVTSRLVLTPLELADAPSMVGVLGDPALYAHTGGSPPDLEELRSRYHRQLDGPRPPGQAWLNWVVRLPPREPIGYIQATVTEKEADLAWVIATAHQRQGYATEATRGVAEWLGRRSIRRLTAHVAPGHAGSERVATGVGMRPTGDFDDAGEQIWHLDTSRLR
jgi:RimJ/RimL family protein N-acetyltransferase